MNHNKILLTKREIGIIGLIVFLIYDQFSEADFDSIIGRSKVDRDTAIISLKTSIAKNSICENNTRTCEINEFDQEILFRIISQIGNGFPIRDALFDVSEDEINILKNKFASV